MHEIREYCIIDQYFGDQRASATILSFFIRMQFKILYKATLKRHWENLDTFFVVDLFRPPNEISCESVGLTAEANHQKFCARGASKSNMALSSNQRKEAKPMNSKYSLGVTYPSRY
jgi:hypothetical protein